MYILAGLVATLDTHAIYVARTNYCICAPRRISLYREFLRRRKEARHLTWTIYILIKNQIHWPILAGRRLGYEVLFTRLRC